MGEHGRPQFPYVEPQTPAKRARPDMPTRRYAITPDIRLAVMIVRDSPVIALGRTQAEPDEVAISMDPTTARVLLRTLQGGDADARIASPAWWDWTCRGWFRQDAKLSIGSDIFVFRLEGESVGIAKADFPLPTSLRLRREEATSLIAALDAAFVWVDTALKNRSRLSG